MRKMLWMCLEILAALVLAACRGPLTPTPLPSPTATPPAATAGSIVRTVAGSGKLGDLGGGYVDGPALQAQFRRPAGLAMDAAGNLYVADLKNQRIRKLTPAGQVVTVAGSGSARPVQGDYVDGPVSSARFADPIGVCLGPDGCLYVADSDNHRIRLVSNRVVSTLAGSGTHGSLLGGYLDGPAAEAQFSRPYDVVFGPHGDLLVADYFNHVIRRISPDGEVTSFAGNGVCGFADGPASSARLAYPNRLAIDALGNLYFTEGHSRDMYESRSGNRVRRITPEGLVSTIAGSGKPDFQDGPAATAQFDTPMGLDVDLAGNVYVADYLNHCIRVITPGGEVRTLAGTARLEGYQDGPAASALFSYPMDVLVSPEQRTLYVADFGNHRIRAISLPQPVMTHCL
jgi:DNA-binding beta-propeller fold protein YncE